jgi:DNA-binding CsgD family transcriptional regulator
VTVKAAPGLPLSPAELRVADLVAEGLSNPQIAARLHLSPRTVQTQVSYALKKLGLRSRVQLALHIRDAQRGASTYRVTWVDERGPRHSGALTLADANHRFTEVRLTPGHYSVHLLTEGQFHAWVGNIGRHALDAS